MSQSANGDSSRQNSEDSQLIINSLEQTIQQLQTALNLINQTDNRDNLLNTRIVKNLVDSSNQLLNSLEKKSSVIKLINPLDDNLPENQFPVQDNNEDWLEDGVDEKMKKKTQTSTTVKTQINQHQRRRKNNNNLFNFILITLAIIIISLISWWLYNSDILRGKNSQSNPSLDFNTEIDSQELVREKSPQITKIKPQENTDLNLNSNLEQSNNPDLTEQINVSKLERQDDLELDLSNQTIINQNSQADSLDKVINDNLNIAKKSEQIAVKPNNIDKQLTEENSPFPLTPEQNLIKNIEDKIETITKNYEGDLIISIKVDFGKNYLLVFLSNEWYNLTENQQDELIKTIYSQAKTIDLNKLEIKDLSQNLLARSAVVGNKVIIINRY